MIVAWDATKVCIIAKKYAGVSYVYESIQQYQYGRAHSKHLKVFLRNPRGCDT